MCWWASRCSSGCTSGNNFSSAPSSPLLHSQSSWVTACCVDRGVVMKSSRRRTLYHDRGIFTAQPGAIEKKLRSRGGSYAASSLTHMNRHNQQTRRKTKTEIKPKKTHENQTISNQLKHPFNRHSRLWLARSTRSWSGCSCTGP